MTFSLFESVQFQTASIYRQDFKLFSWLNKSSEESEIELNIVSIKVMQYGTALNDCAESIA